MRKTLEIVCFGILLFLSGSTNAKKTKTSGVADPDTTEQQKTPHHGRTKLDTEKNADLFMVEQMNNQTAASGDDVVFKCKVRGYTKRNFQFKWFMNNVLISTKDDFRFFIHERRRGSRLVIKSVYTLDEGEYKCKASTGHETVESSGHLTVTFKLPPPIDNREIYTVKIPHGRCEKYRGSVCSEFFQGKKIFVESFQDQDEMEKKLIEALSLFSETNFTSLTCKQFSLPAICFFVYPQCDADQEVYGKKLCKEDCEKIKNDICLQEYLQSKENPFLHNLFETAQCSSLPSSNCSRIELLKAEFASDCYSGDGSSYTGNVNQHAANQFCWPWPKDFTKRNPELIGHNFCRNPNGEFNQPWCFVDENAKIACNIPKCENARKISLLFLIMLIASVGFFFSFFIFSMAWCCYCKNRKLFYRPASSKKTTGLKVPQIRASSIEILSEIGIWECGKIYQGTVTDYYKDLFKQPLAFKFFQKLKEKSRTRKLIKEIEILSKLNHPSITNIKAACMEPDCFCILYEYTNHVDLHEYLLLNSPVADTTKQPPTRLGKTTTISDDLLVSMALQISSGLEYLERRNYIHRDLAARSVLVCENTKLKISVVEDIKNSHVSCYCKYLEGNLLPVRWMPPEVLESKIFSCKCTVWSFGVLLWEIYSHGAQPYSAYSNDDVIDMILNRELLACPDQCPPQMYSLMLECWTSQPNIRPDFSMISKRIEKFRRSVSSVTVKSFSFAKNKSHFAPTLSDYHEKQPILKNFNAV